MSKNLNVYLNTLKQKGYLAYEYNPFYNYQTDVDLYKIDTDVGEIKVPEGYAVNKKNGDILIKKQDKWIDSRNNIINQDDILIPNSSSKKYAKAGSLIELDTEQLNFDLEHPVDITIQPSYDGSVNLILNDDKNIPRIINSRFSAREKGTYEIVDRIGENDTNIYNSKTFDKDTSLYFQYEYNPEVQYMGFVKGILPVGQYCFYFTYCDSDDNESDYIAETGVIPVFIGGDNDPNSIDGGIKNQLSNKGIRLKLSNIDKSYNYFKVYYVRYFADYQQNRVYECKKIYKKYPINSSTIYLQITGNEEAEDLDANILNISRFNPKSILTQAQCKNMLFFGNIVKNSDNYRELRDCALRIYPELETSTISTLNSTYSSEGNEYGYYNSTNMYNKVGYFNNEYYRFGVVFIYQNGTLSNVYNTLGGDLGALNLTGDIFKENSSEGILTRNYIKIDDNGWIKTDSEYTLTGTNINSRGVCHIKKNELNYNEVLGIKFHIPQDVLNYLKSDLGIRGLFFVRQKCVPNILAQCYLLPMDDVLKAPVLEYGANNYVTECFVTQYSVTEHTSIVFGQEYTSKTKEGGRLVINDYKSRLFKYDDNDPTKKNPVSKESISSHAYAAICPDFLLNQPYYNQIFNGNKFRLSQITKKSESKLNQNGRLYNQKEHAKQEEISSTKQVTICTVTEDVPTVSLENKTYKLKIGTTEEAYKFEYAGVDNGSYNAGDEDFDSINEATNIVRGMYSPYLAVYSNTPLTTNVLYNIYQDNISSDTQEYQNRMDSSEPFYSISNRYNFDGINVEKVNSKYYRSLTCWKGDCYINNFTYRLNRNFNDPSLPNNDKIIDINTWRDHYNAADSSEWENISRSDINAVQLGSWITIQLRSAMNYALRSEDNSYVSEKALMGTPRSFYPRSKLLQLGENKLPDSYLYNDAYRASLGFKCYFVNNDINYIKDTFSNRIQYSAISIQDSFKNNFRYSLSTYFRDYSQEYGSIQKLVGFEGYLLVVFEHAIGIAVVNERILMGEGDGEPVFINTKNVLPEELTIISDTYGSQWPESVIKSEAGYVYGVDTVAKKIWRVKGQQIEILSDFKVNKFLIDNISLGERERYPIIGLKNVKTHYNNNKKDVMFTFYDDVYKDEEKVWNLCYNELLGQFITFYSWLPSYSENIDTQYFSFDRNTSKGLSLFNDYYYTKLYYTKQSDVRYEIEKDHWQIYKDIKIEENIIKIKKDLFNEHKIIIVYITPIYNNIRYQTETLAFTTKEIVENQALTQEDKQKFNLTTDFYLHGQAGIFNVVENLYPTHWYGKFHPFEFEFVVNDKIGQQKIFTNLEIISNKAEPESFHFEIEGDNYEFSKDKRAMYFRQEATKNLCQNLGSDMLFDSDVAADNYTFEQYYRGNPSRQFNSETENIENVSGNKYEEKYIKSDKVYPESGMGLVQQVKSSIFPLYYERIDTYDDIYYKYRGILDGNPDTGYDFKNLSGSEIKWIRDLNQFDKKNESEWPIYEKDSELWEFILNTSKIGIDKLGQGESSSSDEYQIQDGTKIPPIVINSSNIPSDLSYDDTIDRSNLPNIYKGNKYTWPRNIDNSDWTYRKETKIRDKWMKVRVRYSGRNLAVIHSLITLYNISYA